VLEEVVPRANLKQCQSRGLRLRGPCFQIRLSEDALERVFWGNEEVVCLFLCFLRRSHIELCWWSAGPTSWAASCVTVESNLYLFSVFRDLSRASCAYLSLSRWKVSVSGSSRDRSFLREWIAS